MFHFYQFKRCEFLTHYHKLSGQNRRLPPKGYRSNCDYAGFEVPHESLTMFLELQVPFEVSIIVT
jgi:hypothetical protein